jgi:hypothetical protein
MKSVQIMGLVALAAILSAGCAARQETDIHLAQGGGGMYSALDATAQVYSHPRAQAPVEDNPWRWVGFALHPLGVGLDYAINRPIYALTSAFPYLFGYTSEDALVTSRRQ